MSIPKSFAGLPLTGEPSAGAADGGSPSARWPGLAGERVTS